MKFATIFVSLALSALSVNAAAIANPKPEPDFHARLFQRDIQARDDPCLTPCYEKVGNYCPNRDCSLQCWICCEINGYRENSCG